MIWRYAGPTVLLGILTSILLFAQAPAYGALPESLKSIKQATGTCARDDAKAGKELDFPSELLPPAALECAIGPAEAAALLAQPNSVAVDTRSAAEFSISHIDGALNMNAATLRVQAFLRNHDVILVGNGKTERELYSSCARLKASGFKQAKVLRGGMPSWGMQGLPVIGKSAGVADLVRLDAPELWVESEFDANLVLVTGGQESVRKSLKFAVSVADLSPGTVSNIIERRRKELKNAPLASVVVVTDPKTEIATLIMLRQHLHPIPVLVYMGGAEAVAQQIKQQHALWAARARGPRKPGCGL